MPETKSPVADSVADTLFIPLYIRAMESKRPDALIHDDKAVSLVAGLDYDFSRFEKIQMDEFDRTALVLRNREFDRYVREFLVQHPEAVVVHAGCGLDSRFERVDNGQVEWYDLDVPEVIALRQKLLGGEGPRCHHLACSAFDPDWIERVKAGPPRPFLFLAEGVFMYFTAEEVKSLVLRLQQNFPGSEMVFDVFSPYLVRMNNLRFALTHYGARYHWGVKDSHDLERWGPGIQMLDEWSYFDRPEPRLARVYWMRHIPMWSHVLRILHLYLEETHG